MTAGKVTIANVTMTTGDTEYNYALPAGTQKVLIKLRGTGAVCKLAYVSGQSGTTYLTIPAGSSKTIEGIKGTAMTLYFQSPTASQVAEIESWK